MMSIMVSKLVIVALATKDDLTYYVDKHLPPLYTIQNHMNNSH